MSIYGYLVCKECKDEVFVKDEDTPVHAGREELGDFLEKHKGCSLKYLWDLEQEYFDLLDEFFESNTPVMRSCIQDVSTGG